MGAAIGYAVRRTSARVVIAVGAGGLLWTVCVMPLDRSPGLEPAYPVPFLWRTDPYRVVGSGFSPWDVAAAALAVAVAVAAAAALWRGRAIAR
jgi:hypothetical protein